MMQKYKILKTMRSGQEGVVMLIALIILIAMTLAGIAVTKALDNSVGVSGNIAFKESSIYGSDKAISDAILWMKANSTILNNDNPSLGYFSSAPNPEPDWTLDTSWTEKKSDGVDGVGNSLEYVIHRMCSQANVAYNQDINQCMMLDAQSGQAAGNSMSAGSFQFVGAPQVAYRITARAQGPRGGYTVVQTFITLPQ